MPKAAAYYAGRTTVVASAGAAAALAALAAAAAAVARRVRYRVQVRRPGVVINQDHTAHDPRSVHPLLLSLALAEPGWR